MKQKQALQGGLSKEYEVSVETIRAMEHTCNQAVATMIVRETRMQISEKSKEQCLVTRTKREARKCFNCGKICHILRDCRQKKKRLRIGRLTESRECVTSAERLGTLPGTVGQKIRYQPVKRL